jgi:cyclophilin family peptidyl-prolyl cis-trans isomerase
MDDDQKQQQQEEHALVDCTTTTGPITLHLHRAWSPYGYDRATSLFERGYYDNSHFFRVVPHFLVQFGISYTTDTELRHFADTTIPDDPKRNDLMPFREGMISFAGSGPNSRTSQLFIAYDKAGGLGNSPWETPFGEVTSGMENVQQLYSGYGDMPPWGHGPEQGPIRNKGASYITENFPLLDKFVTCTVRRLDPSASASSNALSSEEDNEEEEVPKVVDDPSGAGEGLPPDSEMAQYSGTRGGGPLKLKLSNNNPSEEKNTTLYVLGQFSFMILVVVVVVYQCTSWRRKRSSKQAEKNV